MERCAQISFPNLEVNSDAAHTELNDHNRNNEDDLRAQSESKFASFCFQTFSVLAQSSSFDLVLIDINFSAANNCLFSMIYLYTTTYRVAKQAVTKHSRPDNATRARSRMNTNS